MVVYFPNVSKYAYFKINLFIEFYLVDNQDKKSILISFGGNLRQLRLAKGFTQEQLANELGIEISQISRIERGVINTSVTTLYAIANTLKIDVSQLFIFEKIS
ncbi:XRE family transcriptional regulator [Flavobacterium caseinilyticum]|uniref:XRE family transcriptional regulator n=1 Tax=Flavobacterium caseinilyticum TaxID=2541732 RepID=A0A4V2YUN9_9FLAO|nr:XRE family transcriptional regulator [Flavobacterium caseinilyticum]